MEFNLQHVGICYLSLGVNQPNFAFFQETLGRFEFDNTQRVGTFERLLYTIQEIHRGSGSIQASDAVSRYTELFKNFKSFTSRAIRSTVHQ